MPDVNAKWTIAAGCLVTIIVWSISLAGVAVPGEVASSATTLFAILVGIVAGDNSHARRAADAPKRDVTPPATVVPPSSKETGP